METGYNFTHEQLAWVERRNALTGMRGIPMANITSKWGNPISSEGRNALTGMRGIPMGATGKDHNVHFV